MSDFDDALHRELRTLATAGGRQAQGLPGEQVRRVGALRRDPSAGPATAIGVAADVDPVDELSLKVQGLNTPRSACCRSTPMRPTRDPCEAN